MTAEEHRSPQPVLNSVRATRRAEGNEQVPTRSQPGGDTLQQPTVLVPRDVGDRVESCYRIETGRRKDHLSHPSLDEACVRDALTGQRELGGREIDTHHVTDVREPGSAGNSRPAAEVEHVRINRKSRQQIVQEPQPRITLDFVDPTEVLIRDAVVPRLDDFARLRVHGT